MNIKKTISHILGTCILILMSGNIMAFDFPTQPGSGGSTGGTTGSGNGTLIFYCLINDIGNSMSESGSSSCSNTGGTSSSCSSNNTSGNTSSAVIAFEMTTPKQDLESVLLNANTCAEAVKAAGNCTSSGGDTKIIYTCKY